MSRYDIVKKNRDSNVKIKGSLNPTKLQENGIDVLTIKNIAHSLDTDGTDKVPSIKLLRYIVENNIGNGNGNGNITNGGGNVDFSKEEVISAVAELFIKNFLDNIIKERDDNLSRIQILTNETPELIGDESRTNLIDSSNEYTEICTEIKTYINNILESNQNIDYIVESELNNKFELYKKKLNTISYDTQIAINRLSQIKSDMALEEANKHTDSIANQIVYKLEIHSSNGSIFKKGTIDTTLTAVLYKGKEVVTEQFLPIRFVWTRNSHDSVSDERWNSSSRRDYSIKVTSDDMNGSQSTFNCTVLDENGNKIVSAF